VGDKVSILGPRYNPSSSMEKHRSEDTIPQLFLLMGRSLHPIKEVHAGQVFGIGGNQFVSRIVKARTVKCLDLYSSNNLFGTDGYHFKHASLFQFRFHEA